MEKEKTCADCKNNPDNTECDLTCEEIFEGKEICPGFEDK